MLKEKATYYYLEKNQNCAVSMMMAANECYEMGLSEEACLLFAGFGGGMGCGSVCGALTGSIGVLSKLYAGMDKEALRTVCAGFVAKFEEKLSCGSIDCNVIGPKYKEADKRCLAAVLLAAECMEEYLAELSFEEK